MEINQFLTTVNYTKGSNKKNKWIVIHYTANNGDTAKNNCNYFSTLNRGASANYFVDENSIWQCVKDEDIAWHVGAKKYYNDCRNSNSIGIEMCSRKSGVYYFKDETVKNTIQLTKYLMNKYNIPISNVVRHYDVTHKICPEPFVRNEEGWRKFLIELNKEEVMSQEEQIELIKEKVGIDDNTIQYLKFYKYGDALIEKIAKALRED